MIFCHVEFKIMPYNLCYITFNKVNLKIFSLQEVFSKNAFEVD